MPQELVGRAIAFIPDDEVNRLRHLREQQYLPALRARIKALRVAGWTLAGIGAPFEVPFSTVRAWESAADPAACPIPYDDVPTPGRPPRQAGQVIRVRKFRAEVPPAEHDRLRQLSEEARILRRTTSRDHPAWHSQAELESLLARYLARGVKKSELARICGVSHRAIGARMERSALRRPAPSSGKGMANGIARVEVMTFSTSTEPGAEYGGRTLRRRNSATEGGFVTIWKDPESRHAGLLSYANGNKIAVRSIDEVSRATNPSPTVLQDRLEDRDFLDAWLAGDRDADLQAIAVPAAVALDILGWEV